MPQQRGRLPVHYLGHVDDISFIPLVQNLLLALDDAVGVTGSLFPYRRGDWEGLIG